MLFKQRIATTERESRATLDPKIYRMNDIYPTDTFTTRYDRLKAASSLSAC